MDIRNSENSSAQGCPHSEEIKRILSRVDRNGRAHTLFALRQQRLDNWCTAISAIGGIAIVGFSAFIMGSAEEHFIFEAVIVIFGALITCVAVAQAIWRPAEKYQQHREYAASFNNIKENCRHALNGDCPEIKVDELSRLSGEGSRRASLIPERLWKKYRRQRNNDKEFN